MKKFLFATLAMILTLSAFGVQVSPAFAAVEPPIPGGRQLVALLSGPAIDGVVPEGKAGFLAFQDTARLDIQMSNLNLADGACLNVAFGRTAIEGIGVQAGSAFVSLRSSVEQIHPGELITISIGEPLAGQTQCGGVLGEGVLSPATGAVLAPATGTVVLSGTFQDGSGTK